MTLALPKSTAVGPGGHFFGTARTISTFETAFYRPLVSTTQNHGAWQEAGGKSASERATAIWQQTLQTYTEPALDAAIREELVVSRRAAEKRVGHHWTDVSGS